MMTTPKRILAIKLSSFGDILHALPAVHNLRTSLGARVDWVTQPEYADLVRCCPDVDQVIPFPRREFWARLPGFTRLLRQQRYDYVIDFQGLMKSAVVAWLARGGRRIGPSFHREGSRFLYDVVAGPCDKNRHAVEENLDVVRYLGLPVLPVEFPVAFPEQVADQPAPRVGLVPLSRRLNKNWPLDRFTQAARRLQAEFGASVYLFGSRGDHEACEQMRSSLLAHAGAHPVVNLAGQTSLVEMGGWFRQMNLVLVNDSGPLHMAVALGIPVVTMFGPTDPVRTGPYGRRGGVCISGVACRPCYAKVCSRSRVECMEGISVEQVVGEARTILGKR